MRFHAQVFAAQLKELLRKQALVRFRTWQWTLCEVFLPLGFIALIAGLRIATLKEVNDMPPETHEDLAANLLDTSFLLSTVANGNQLCEWVDPKTGHTQRGVFAVTPPTWGRLFTTYLRTLPEETLLNSLADRVQVFNNEEEILQLWQQDQYRSKDDIPGHSQSRSHGCSSAASSTCGIDSNRRRHSDAGTRDSRGGSSAIPLQSSSSGSAQSTGSSLQEHESSGTASSHVTAHMSGSQDRMNGKRLDVTDGQRPDAAAAGGAPSRLLEKPADALRRRAICGALIFDVEPSQQSPVEVTSVEHHSSSALKSSSTSLSTSFLSALRTYLSSSMLSIPATPSVSQKNSSHDSLPVTTSDNKTPLLSHAGDTVNGVIAPETAHRLGGFSTVPANGPYVSASSTKYYLGEDEIQAFIRTAMHTAESVGSPVSLKSVQGQASENYDGFGGADESAVLGHLKAVRLRLPPVVGKNFFSTSRRGIWHSGNQLFHASTALAHRTGLRSAAWYLRSGFVGWLLLVYAFLIEATRQKLVDLRKHRALWGSTAEEEASLQLQQRYQGNPSVQQQRYPEKPSETSRVSPSRMDNEVRKGDYAVNADDGTRRHSNEDHPSRQMPVLSIGDGPRENGADPHVLPNGTEIGISKAPAHLDLSPDVKATWSMGAAATSTSASTTETEVPASVAGIQLSAVPANVEKGRDIVSAPDAAALPSPPLKTYPHVVPGRYSPMHFNAPLAATPAAPPGAALKASRTREAANTAGDTKVGMWESTGALASSSLPASLAATVDSAGPLATSIATEAAEAAPKYEQLKKRRNSSGQAAAAVSSVTMRTAKQPAHSPVGAAPARELWESLDNLTSSEQQQKQRAVKSVRASNGGVGTEGLNVIFPGKRDEATAAGTGVDATDAAAHKNQHAAAEQKEQRLRKEPQRLAYAEQSSGARKRRQQEDGTVRPSSGRQKAELQGGAQHRQQQQQHVQSDTAQELQRQRSPQDGPRHWERREKHDGRYEKQRIGPMEHNRRAGSGRTEETVEPSETLLSMGSLIALLAAPLPTLSWRRDLFLPAVGEVLILMLLLGFAVSLVSLQKQLVGERETGRRAVMSAMGLHAQAYYFSWFLDCLCVYAPLIFGGAAVLCGTQVLPSTPAPLVAGLFTVAAAAFATWALALSTLFSNARQAGSVTLLAHLGPYVAMKSLEDTILTRSSCLAWSILPQSAFVIACRIIVDLEIESLSSFTVNPTLLSVPSPTASLPSTTLGPSSDGSRSNDSSTVASVMTTVAATSAAERAEAAAAASDANDAARWTTVWSLSGSQRVLFTPVEQQGSLCLAQLLLVLLADWLLYALIAIALDRHVLSLKVFGDNSSGVVAVARRRFSVYVASLWQQLRSASRVLRGWPRRCLQRGRREGRMFPLLEIQHGSSGERGSTRPANRSARTVSFCSTTGACTEEADEELSCPGLQEQQENKDRHYDSLHNDVDDKKTLSLRHRALVAAGRCVTLRHVYKWFSSADSQVSASAATVAAGAAGAEEAMEAVMDRNRQETDDFDELDRTTAHAVGLVNDQYREGRGLGAPGARTSCLIAPETPLMESPDGETPSAASLSAGGRTRLPCGSCSSATSHAKATFVKAVNGVSLQLYEGEVFVLLGPNGAGKSTLMNVITGLEVATSGRVEAFGCVLPRDCKRLQQQLGICPQNNVLWPELTVYEHCRLFAAIKGVRDEEPAPPGEERLTATAGGRGGLLAALLRPWLSSCTAVEGQGQQGAQREHEAAESGPFSPGQQPEHQRRHLFQQTHQQEMTTWTARQWQEEEQQEELEQQEQLPKAEELQQSDEHVADDIWAFLSSLSLDGVAHRLVKDLSGGMRRRVMVALCLLFNPKLCVLDEPSSGLDPAHREALFTLLQLVRPRSCVLVSTQHTEDAEAVADRVGVMHEGRLLCVGTPFDLRRRFGGGYRLRVLLKDSPHILGSSQLQFTTSTPPLSDPNDSDRQTPTRFVDSCVARGDASDHQTCTVAASSAACVPVPVPISVKDNGTPAVASLHGARADTSSPYDHADAVFSRTSQVAAVEGTRREPVFPARDSASSLFAANAQLPSQRHISASAATSLSQRVQALVDLLETTLNDPANEQQPDAEVIGTSSMHTQRPSYSTDEFKVRNTSAAGEGTAYGAVAHSLATTPPLRSRCRPTRRAMVRVESVKLAPSFHRYNEESATERKHATVAAERAASTGESAPATTGTAGPADDNAASGAATAVPFLASSQCAEVTIRISPASADSAAAPPQKLSRALHALKAAEDRIGITSFGVYAPSMRDVFINVCSLAYNQKAKQQKQQQLHGAVQGWEEARSRSLSADGHRAPDLAFAAGAAIKSVDLHTIGAWINDSDVAAGGVTAATFCAHEEGDARTSSSCAGIPAALSAKQHGQCATRPQKKGSSNRGFADRRSKKASQPLKDAKRPLMSSADDTPISSPVSPSTSKHALITFTTGQVTPHPAVTTPANDTSGERTVAEDGRPVSCDLRKGTLREREEMGPRENPAAVADTHENEGVDNAVAKAAAAVLKRRRRRVIALLLLNRLLFLRRSSRVTLFSHIFLAPLALASTLLLVWYFTSPVTFDSPPLRMDPEAALELPLLEPHNSRAAQPRPSPLSQRHSNSSSPGGDYLDISKGNSGTYRASASAPVTFMRGAASQTSTESVTDIHDASESLDFGRYPAFSSSDSSSGNLRWSNARKHRGQGKPIKRMRLLYGASSASLTVAVEHFLKNIAVMPSAGLRRRQKALTENITGTQETPPGPESSQGTKHADVERTEETIPDLTGGKLQESQCRAGDNVVELTLEHLPCIIPNKLFSWPLHIIPSNNEKGFAVEIPSTSLALREFSLHALRAEEATAAATMEATGAEAEVTTADADEHQYRRGPFSIAPLVGAFYFSSNENGVLSASDGSEGISDRGAEDAVPAEGSLSAGAAAAAATTATKQANAILTTTTAAFCKDAHSKNHSCNGGNETVSVNSSLGDQKGTPTAGPKAHVETASVAATGAPGAVYVTGRLPEMEQSAMRGEGGAYPAAGNAHATPVQRLNEETSLTGAQSLAGTTSSVQRSPLLVEGRRGVSVDMHNDNGLKGPVQGPQTAEKKVTRINSSDGRATEHHNTFMELRANNLQERDTPQEPSAVYPLIHSNDAYAAASRDKWLSPPGHKANSSSNTAFVEQGALKEATAASIALATVGPPTVSDGSNTLVHSSALSGGADIPLQHSEGAAESSILERQFIESHMQKQQRRGDVALRVEPLSSAGTVNERTAEAEMRRRRLMSNDRESSAEEAEELLKAYNKASEKPTLDHSQKQQNTTTANSRDGVSVTGNEKQQQQRRGTAGILLQVEDVHDNGVAVATVGRSGAISSTTGDMAPEKLAGRQSAARNEGQSAQTGAENRVRELKREVANNVTAHWPASQDPSGDSILHAAVVTESSRSPGGEITGRAERVAQRGSTGETATTPAGLSSRSSARMRAVHGAQVTANEMISVPGVRGERPDVGSRASPTFSAAARPSEPNMEPRILFGGDILALENEVQTCLGLTQTKPYPPKKSLSAVMLFSKKHKHALPVLLAGFMRGLLREEQALLHQEIRRMKQFHSEKISKEPAAVDFVRGEPFEFQREVSPNPEQNHPGQQRPQQVQGQQHLDTQQRQEHRVDTGQVSHIEWDSDHWQAGNANAFLRRPHTSPQQHSDTPPPPSDCLQDTKEEKQAKRDSQQPPIGGNYNASAPLEQDSPFPSLATPVTCLHGSGDTTSAAHESEGESDGGNASEELGLNAVGRSPFTSLYHDKSSDGLGASVASGSSSTTLSPRSSASNSTRTASASKTLSEEASPSAHKTAFPDVLARSLSATERDLLLLLQGHRKQLDETTPLATAADFFREDVPLINHPLPASLTSGDSRYLATVDSFLASVSVLFAFCSMPATVLNFLAAEAFSQLKFLQLSAGVSPTTYWLTSFLFDFTAFVISLLLTLVVLVTFRVRLILSYRLRPALLLLLLGFGAAAVAHSSFVSVCLHIFGGGVTTSIFGSFAATSGSSSFTSFATAGAASYAQPAAMVFNMLLSPAVALLTYAMLLLSLDPALKFLESISHLIANISRLLSPSFALSHALLALPLCDERLQNDGSFGVHIPTVHISHARNISRAGAASSSASSGPNETLNATRNSTMRTPGKAAAHSDFLAGEAYDRLNGAGPSNLCTSPWELHAAGLDILFLFVDALLYAAVTILLEAFTLWATHVPPSQTNTWAEREATRHTVTNTETSVRYHSGYYNSSPYTDAAPYDGNSTEEDINPYTLVQPDSQEQNVCVVSSGSGGTSEVSGRRYAIPRRSGSSSSSHALTPQSGDSPRQHSVAGRPLALTAHLRGRANVDHDGRKGLSWTLRRASLSLLRWARWCRSSLRFRSHHRPRPEGPVLSQWSQAFSASIDDAFHHTHVTRHVESSFSTGDAQIWEAPHSPSAAAIDVATCPTKPSLDALHPKQGPGVATTATETYGQVRQEDAVGAPSARQQSATKTQTAVATCQDNTDSEVDSGAAGLTDVADYASVECEAEALVLLERRGYSSRRQRQEHLRRASVAAEVARMQHMSIGEQQRQAVYAFELQKTYYLQSELTSGVRALQRRLCCCGLWKRPRTVLGGDCRRRSSARSLPPATLVVNAPCLAAGAECQENRVRRSSYTNVTSSATRPCAGGDECETTLANTERGKGLLVNAASLESPEGTLTESLVRAVRNISFAAQEGEVIAVVGQNGAGKSTTLRMLCGLELPDRGIVRIGTCMAGWANPLAQCSRPRSADLYSRCCISSTDILRPSIMVDSSHTDSNRRCRSRRHVKEGDTEDGVGTSFRDRVSAEGRIVGVAACKEAATNINANTAIPPPHIVVMPPTEGGQQSIISATKNAPSAVCVAGNDDNENCRGLLLHPQSSHVPPAALEISTEGEATEEIDLKGNSGRRHAGQRRSRTISGSLRVDFPVKRHVYPAKTHRSELTGDEADVQTAADGAATCGTGLVRRVSLHRHTSQSRQQQCSQEEDQQGWDKDSRQQGRAEGDSTGRWLLAATNAITQGYMPEELCGIAVGSLGICPQEETLWEFLTPREHLRLFAAIRNALLPSGTYEEALLLLLSLRQFDSLLVKPPRVSKWVYFQLQSETRQRWSVVVRLCEDALTLFMIRAILNPLACADEAYTDAALEREVEETLAAVQLLPHAEKRAECLSGGMRRKLCLAMAAVCQPSVLLLDEPTCGLDPIARFCVGELISKKTTASPALQSKCPLLSVAPAGLLQQEPRGLSSDTLLSSDKDRQQVTQRHARCALQQHVPCHVDADAKRLPNRPPSCVLLSSHAMEEVEAVASRVLVVEKGELFCIGTPQQISDWFSPGLLVTVQLPPPSLPSWYMLSRGPDPVAIAAWLLHISFSSHITHEAQQQTTTAAVAGDTAGARAFLSSAPSPHLPVATKLNDGRSTVDQPPSAPMTDNEQAAAAEKLLIAAAVPEEARRSASVAGTSLGMHSGGGSDATNTVELAAADVVALCMEFDRRHAVVCGRDRATDGGPTYGGTRTGESRLAAALGASSPFHSLLKQGLPIPAVVFIEWWLLEDMSQRLLRLLRSSCATGVRGASVMQSSPEDPSDGDSRKKLAGSDSSSCPLSSSCGPDQENGNVNRRRMSRQMSTSDSRGSRSRETKSRYCEGRSKDGSRGIGRYNNSGGRRTCPCSVVEISRSGPIRHYAVLNTPFVSRASPDVERGSSRRTSSYAADTTAQPHVSATPTPSPCQGKCSINEYLTGDNGFESKEDAPCRQSAVSRREMSDVELGQRRRRHAEQRRHQEAAGENPVTHMTHCSSGAAYVNDQSALIVNLFELLENSEYMRSAIGFVPLDFTLTCASLHQTFTHLFEELEQEEEETQRPSVLNAEELAHFFERQALPSPCSEKPPGAT